MQEWKANPVTVAVNDAIRSRIEDGRDVLEYAVGEQAFMVQGMIRAFRDILEIKVEEEEINIDD